MKDCAILVLSYDGCSDLWDPFFDLFFRYWPDCPFRVYLQTNEKEYEREGVTVLRSGKRTDWAQAAKKVTAMIEEEYVFLMLEDYFLLAPVDTARMKAHFAFVSEHDLDALALKYRGTLKTPYPEYEEISYRQAYCVTFAFHFMKTSLFASLCKDGYSPWDFENRNSFEALERKKMPGLFYATKRDEFPCWQEGVLAKEKWTRKAYRRFRREDVAIDLRTHPLMTRRETLKRGIKSFVSACVPTRLKAKLKSRIQGEKQ